MSDDTSKRKATDEIMRRLTRRAPISETAVGVTKPMLETAKDTILPGTHGNAARTGTFQSFGRDHESLSLLDTSLRLLAQSERTKRI
jgi:hypothetical protein